MDWKERHIRNESAILNLSTKLAVHSMSPANQDVAMSREAAASAFVLQISKKIPSLVSPIRRLFTFADGEPLGLKLLKKLYNLDIGRASGESPSSINPVTNVTGHAAHLPRSSSWLSDVKFLTTLTRSTMLNNLVIDALEGQIITIAVVTAFVLIFLIREWVVQQQPNLFGGAEARVNLLGPQNADDPVLQPEDQRHQAPHDEGDVGVADAGVQVQGPRARMIARPRRPARPRQTSEQGAIERADVATERSEHEDVDAENSKLQANVTDNDPTDQLQGSPQRPAMPDRDKLARAAEIRRTIEERSRVSKDGDDPGNTFQELWNRAENRPSEVIKIIDDEGRNDELSWIVTTMRKIEKLSSVNVQEGQIVSPSDEPITAALGNTDKGSTSSRRPSDDEGFVVLDNLSHVNSAPKVEQSVNTESSLNLDHEAVAEASRSSAGKSQGSPGTSRRSSYYSQDQNALLSYNMSDPAQNSTEDRAEDQEVPTKGAKKDLDNAGSNDAPVRIPNSNPFHPDYEGELPEGNATAGIPVLGQPSEELLLETTQPGTPPYEANEANAGQTQPDLPQGNFDRRRGLLERVTDWLWGGAEAAPSPSEQPAGDDEHVVNNIADEAPFVPMEHGHPLRAADNDAEVPGQDPEVVAAAIQAGLDPNEVEAADDIEDLEGIMELVGMQGPLAGLVQNAMFCACLVSLTIFFGVWIPYISGKLFLVFLAHPVSLLLKLPLRCAASTADMVIDAFTFGIACTFYWTDIIVRLLCTPLGWAILPLAKINQNSLVAEMARTYAEGALERLMRLFAATGNVMFESDIPAFSVNAHESLLSIEGRARWLLHGLCDYIGHCFNVVYNISGSKEVALLFTSGVVNQGKALTAFVYDKAPSILASIASVSHFHPLHVNLSITARSTPLDYDLAYWDTKDRTLAIIFGYLFFAFLGMIYLNLNARIRGINKAERVAGVLADILYQAGGILKVILIISIEMIVFPLYCGMLLDVALLPLFGSASLMSRIEFTMSSPYTSIFVHWFVGTCYMFHFALFVAMCRKLMRNGVLCKLIF